MDMELLAPVGDFDSLKMAIYHGANAVYLGVNKFNARNNIAGFDLTDLDRVVRFAHIYGVKVYLAVNILFRDAELEQALDLIKQANNIGIDAFIVQDVGLAYLIKKHYNFVEIHASTQMAVHNLEGVRMLEKLGFSRVVLARETSLAEIERIHKHSNIQIEFFVQGALCVSFSGNCYICSHLVGKSGNRGVCQQFCRLPYSFESGNVRKSGFLLSAKDICMLDNLEDLAKAGVYSLKIEGRARRPFYVAQACDIYRQKLDCGKCSQQQVNQLRIAFNRDFIPAYFNDNGNIISKIQGNNGLFVGTITKVNFGKKFNEVFVKSNYKLSGKMGLKFCLNGVEKLSVGAYNIQQVGGLYKFTTTAKLQAGWDVHIIQDGNLEASMLGSVKKIPVSVEMEAIPELPITAKAELDGISVEVKGEVCERAKTINTQTEQVLKQMSRHEIFEISNFKCELNNCYILNSAINKLRNELYEKLIEKILEKYKKNKLNTVKIKQNANFKPKAFNYQIVQDEDLPVKKAGKDNILIYDYAVFDRAKVSMFDEDCKRLGVKGYLDIPPFATSRDIELIKQVLADSSLGIVANNLYAFTFDCDMVVGQFANVYNSYSVKALRELHNFNNAFVEELTLEQIKKFNVDVGINKRENVYMTLLHCPFKQNVGGDCGKCKYGDATYTMNSGHKFKVYRKKTSSCVFMLKD